MSQKNNRVALSFLFGFTIGLFSFWIYSVSLYTPPDSEFLKSAVSSYLRYASDKRISGYISYYDCKVELADANDQLKHGVKMYGLCSYTLDGVNYDYTVALNSKAEIEFSEE